MSIFFKSVDISTIDIRYRYIEQGYGQQNIGLPAWECLESIHPTEEHSPILRIFLCVEEVLKPLLSNHHQAVALRKADQGGKVDEELWAIHHLSVQREIKRF